MFCTCAVGQCIDTSFSKFDGKCYRYFQSSTDYQDANRKCQDYNNGYLVSISSQREYDYVMELTKNATSGNLEFWIGLSDKKTEGVFLWENPQAALDSNGQLVFHRWAPNQPGATNSQSRDCVTMQITGWHVRTFGCAVANGLPYVCQTSGKARQAVNIPRWQIILC